MEPARIDFNIHQGIDWNQPLKWTGDSQPVDLSGYTARMQIRPSVDAPRVLAELTTENGRLILGGTAGTIVMKLDHASTRSFWWTSGFYDLELIGPDGSIPVRLCRGTITVVREVTRERIS